MVVKRLTQGKSCVCGISVCVYQCVYIVVCTYSSIYPYPDRSRTAGLAMGVSVGKYVYNSFRLMRFRCRSVFYSHHIPTSIHVSCENVYVHVLYYRRLTFLLSILFTILNSAFTLSETRRFLYTMVPKCLSVCERSKSDAVNSSTVVDLGVSVYVSVSPCN